MPGQFKPMNFENLKQFNSAIEFIKITYESRVTKISLREGLWVSVGKLSRSGIKGFELEIQHNTSGLNHDFESYPSELEINNLSIVSNDWYIKEQEFSSHNDARCLLQIDKFHSSNFNISNQKYYRLIIPNKGRSNLFWKHVNAIDFSFITESSRSVTKRACVRVQCSNVLLDIYQFWDNESHSAFLIIDSFAPIKLEEFSSHCFSSLLAIGYIIGKFYQNEGFYFSYNDACMNHFDGIYYQTLRDSIDTFFPIIDNNPGKFLSIKRSDVPLLKEELLELSFDEISKLSTMAHESMELSSILLLILESSSSSLMVMPSGYAIALEGLRSFIVKNSEKTKLPIENIELAENLIQALIKVVQNIESEAKNTEGQFDSSIIINKIKNLNTSPNDSKLSRPFEILGIELTSEDKAALKRRNSLLHGNIYLDKTIEESDSKLYYTALRLHSLCSLLILKAIGFKGRIVNYPKIHEGSFKMTLEESPYRKV